MSLGIEAMMLFKIKAVRSDLSKFSDPTPNSHHIEFKEVVRLLRRAGGRSCILSCVQTRNVIENKWSRKGITHKVYENKSLIKKCQNVNENARDSMILDPRKCEKMPQIHAGPINCRKQIAYTA